MPEKSIKVHLRIGLKLLASIGCTELLIMTLLRLVRIETWMSPLLIILTDALLLCVAASFLIFYWVVKPMKILEEREKAKEALASMARFPEENPAPVMRFSPDGTILYANSASLPLRKLWNSELGQKVPADMANSVMDVCKTSVCKEVEVVCGDTIFSLIITSIENAQYVNVYGRDITERKQGEDALRERIKEFECINNISRLTTEPWMSIEEFVQQAVGILPPAWRYPEVCAARIMLNSKEFKTANFQETEWSQSAELLVDKKKFGMVTVCYLEEKPAADEGPFLKEERSLINTIADFLGHIIQHRLSEAEIRASEEKFRIIFDSANDGILLADAESKKFHFANATICRMLGYSQEEIKNMGVMDIHPEKDIPYVIEQFEKQFRKEVNVARDLPVKRKDGSVFYADISTAPVEISGESYLLGIFSDITEHKRADEMIALLNRRNELILKSAGEGIYGIDLNGNTTFINPSATKMTGWEAGELIGKRQHDILHHSKQDGTPYLYGDCPIYATHKDGAMHHIVDEVFWKKDGTSFPVEYTSTPIVEDGKVSGAVVVFRDITEQKHAEELINRNYQIQNILNSLLQVSLEGIPLKELLVKALDIILSVPFLPLIPKGGIFVVEDKPEVLILAVNRGFSGPIQEICARVPFGRCLCGRAAASKQIQGADCIDERHENRYDGMINHGHYNIPILSRGHVLGVLVLYLEEGHQQEKSEIEFLQAVADTLAGIIERKQLENALLKFNDELKEKVKERIAELEKANIELKKLFNAIEQSDESIVITDVNGDIQYVNPAFTRKTGYSREEAKGKNPRILKSGQTSIILFNELWKTILSGIPWKGTLINKKKSGEIYYEDATIAPVFDELGKITHFVAAKTDVTDRIMAEKELKIKNTELKLAKETAELANRAKSDFLAHMSHELRTPLNSIIGFSEILECGIAGPIADNQKELLNDISSSGKHLLSLINDILDLSKVEAGKMKLELSEFNIEELIDGSLVMFKEKAMKQNIKLVAEVEEGIGGIDADERKIKQIMFNLLSNAFKFTPDGGSVRVAARRISSAMGAFLVPALSHAGPPQEMPQQEGDFVEISVIDTGIGISHEDQKKLFQPFQQIDSALSRKYSGTGLGLNLCKQFVELHGGKIWIESEEGKGSKFIFVISSKTKPATGKIVDPVTKLLTWEHVMMHINRILSFHKRKGRRLGLIQMEVFSDKPMDYAALTEILKKTIRKHEVLGHGERHGWYYVILSEVDRQMVDNAVMRIKKVLADNGYSADATTVIYPDDGENTEELLKALEG